MKTKNHRAPRLVAAALAAGMALSACGGSGSTTATTAAGTGSTTATTAAGTAASTTTTAAGTAVPTTSTTTAAGAPATTDASGPVLPVTSNPINNPATAQGLKIDSVLVENNVDASGNAVDDHLEIALANTGSTELRRL